VSALTHDKKPKCLLREGILTGTLSQIPCCEYHWMHRSTIPFKSG